MLRLAQNIDLVPTLDGSFSIENKNTGEWYHSKFGAVQESRHVFIEHGLKQATAKQPGELNILEVGFGTGLNFLLTSDLQLKIPIKYSALEPYLLPLDIISGTGYKNFIKNTGFFDYFIARYDAELSESLSPLNIILENMDLEIHNKTLKEFETTKRFDLVYYDAFSATSQPLIWDDEHLDKACSLMNEGGIFITYCIRGHVKRALERNGLKTEKLPGAPGKREMLRGEKAG